jgi:hypothetical protein
MILAQRSQVRQASVDRADQHAYLANVWYQPNEGPTSGSLLRCSLASAVCQRSETAFECLVSAADQQGWGKQHQHQGTRAQGLQGTPRGMCCTASVLQIRLRVVCSQHINAPDGVQLSSCWCPCSAPPRVFCNDTCAFTDRDAFNCGACGMVNGYRGMLKHSILFAIISIGLFRCLCLINRML